MSGVLTEPSPPQSAAARPAKPAARAAKPWWSKWRVWLRALHRDIGYLAVGLTLVYALSGLAVNHISDWDPNYVNYAREVALEGPLPDDDQAAAALVMAAAGVSGTPTDVYRVSGTELEVLFDRETLYADTTKGVVAIEGQRPRWLLRIANWLHLNRGKQAWTYFADAYAVFLLYLAISGMFMIKGRNGLFGRGAVLVLIGLLAPLLYVHFSGGPGASG